MWIAFPCTGEVYFAAAILAYPYTNIDGSSSLYSEFVDFKSLICSKQHTFDITKYGYLNLTPHPSNSHYKKELFEARRHIIMESNLYNAVHKKITKVIGEHTGVSSDSLLVADLGCGEGSHLQKILDGCRSRSPVGVGLDISKEGIIMASKRYKNRIWLVGDLANAPFLIQMTPLTWSMDKVRFDAFKYRNLTEITVDLDILVASWYQEIIPDTTRFFYPIPFDPSDRGIAVH